MSLATLFAAGDLAAIASIARVLALTERVVHTMFLTKLKITAAVLLVVVAVGLGEAGLYGALAERPPVVQEPSAPVQLPADPGVEPKKIEPVVAQKPGEDKKPRMVRLDVIVLISAKTEGMSEDAKIKQIDAPKERYEGHTARLECVTFFADGRRIASASQDGTARIWRAPR